MNKTTWFGGSVLALGFLLALGWLFLQLEDSSPSLSNNELADSSSETPAGARRPSEGSVANSDTSFSQDPEPQQTSIKAAPPAEPDIATRTESILVVDEMGRALAGAGVRYYEFAATGGAIETDEVTTSDELGRARLPRPKRYFALSGTKGTRAGEIPHWDPKENADLRLILMPNGIFSVTVVDEESQPVAGVPVQVRRLETNQRVFEDVSDANGEAALRVRLYDDFFGATVGDLRLQLDALFPDCIPVNIDPKSLPEAGVQIVARRARPLVVELRDPSGELVTDPAEVSIQTANTKNLRTARTEGGRAVLGPVQEGSAFTLSVQPLSSTSFGPVDFQVTIDSADTGAEAVVSIPVGKPKLVLKFLLIDQEENPIANEPLKVWTERGIEGRSIFIKPNEWETRTDAEGRVALASRPNQVGDLLNISVPTAKPRIRHLTLTLSSAMESGVIDLGDLQVVAYPPLAFVASGRIIDRSGEPVADARIQFAFWSIPATDSERPYRMGGRQKVWSDSEGRFEARAPQVSGRPEFTIRKRGFQTQVLAVPTGETNLEIVMKAGAIVRGRLEYLDEEMARESSISIEGSTDFDAAKLSPIAANAYAFEFFSVPSGTFQLQFDFPASKLRVPIGEPFEVNADSGPVELGAIQVPRLAKRCQLSVVDSSGQPILRGFSVRETKSGFDQVKPFRGGKIVVFTSEEEEPSTIHVGARGYRSVILSPAPSSSRRITLPPALNVSIRFGNLPDLKERSSLRWQVKLQLDKKAHEGVEDSYASHSLDGFHASPISAFADGNDFRLPLRQAGTYAVRLYLFRYTEFGRGGNHIELPSVVVTDSSRPQRFNLSLNAEEIVEILSQYR